MECWELWQNDRPLRAKSNGAAENRRIVLTSVVDRNISELDVALHQCRIALAWIAIPAASRREKSYGLAGMYHEMAEFSWKLFLFAVALDDGLVDGALGSTEETPRRTLDSIRVAAQVKVMQRPYLDFDTDTATKFPRAAAVSPES